MAKVLNFIVTHALNKRQFTKLVSVVDSQFLRLIIYNNVRWLNCGQVLNRFVELLEEIRYNLNEKENKYPELTHSN